MEKYKCLLVMSVVLSLLIIISATAQNSDTRWYSLSNQEEKEILDEIVISLNKLRSVAVGFNWKTGRINKDGTEGINGNHSYFMVFDDHRNYLLKGKPDGLSSLLESAKSPEGPGFSHISERSWNGSIMRDLYHESKSGNVYGNVNHFKGAEVMAFSVIGRDHSGYSWIERYQNRNETEANYEVQTNNNNKYRVIEIPNNPATIYSRQIFYFDKTKGMAIVRCTVENVYQDENKVVKLSDIQYEDFKQIKGFHIPFKVLRKAENPDIDFTGIQYMTVEEVTVNEDSHEKFLRDFTFPNGSNLYDHILDMPVYVGADSEELENLLYEGMLQAKEDIATEESGQDMNPKKNNCITPTEVHSESPMVLVQKDKPKEITASVPESSKDNPFTLIFISLGICIVLAIFLWIIIRKCRTGCGMLLLIVYCVFSVTSAFAVNPNIDRKSSHDALDDLVPEHRAIHERDMTRLCGVNCLYQAYIWIDKNRVYSYADLMNMVDYIDGVTIKEIMQCAKQIGLKGEAKIVNYKYLLETAKSAKIALIRATGKKSHFILFLGTESNTSTYYIDYPKGRGHISEDRMLSRFKLHGSDPNNIAIVEFPYPVASEKDSKGLTFTPSKIKIHDDKPWLLGKKPFKFESSLLNNSGKAIDILDVKESCRCSDVTLAKKVIKPGEKIKLNGEISVKPGSSASTQILVLGNSNNSAVLKIDVNADFPFEVSKRNLSFGALASEDNKSIFCDVYINSSYPLKLQDVYFRGKAKDSYVLNAEIVSQKNVLRDGDEILYNKYTIICNIETLGTKPLHAVHELVLPFEDNDRYEFNHLVPVRFQVLKTILDTKQNIVKE